MLVETRKNHYHILSDSLPLCYDGKKDVFLGWVVRDREAGRKKFKRAESHIAQGDYFGTLATILFLIQGEKKELEKKHNKLLRLLKDELVYLQENYKIEKKSSTPK